MSRGRRATAIRDTLTVARARLHQGLIFDHVIAATHACAINRTSEALALDLGRLDAASVGTVLGHNQAKWS